MLKNRRDDAFHYDAKTSRLNLVQEVWEFTIIAFLDVRELALLRPTCRWCEKQWQEFLQRNTLRVPEQIPTIDEAMRVVFNLTKQKVYSKESPLEVVLSEGEHVVEGEWTNFVGLIYENTLNITCSNISFVGQGKDKTTVRGGFGMSNKKNVTFKSLTLTNPKLLLNAPSGGCGLSVEGIEASFEMMGVSVKECDASGLELYSGASVKATQCEFSKNKEFGVYVHGEGSKGIFTDCTFHHNETKGLCSGVAADAGSLVELRGEQTEIHHNRHCGLSAWGNANVNIYIPSRSITALIHDNRLNLKTRRPAMQNLIQIPGKIHYFLMNFSLSGLTRYMGR